MKKLKVFLFLVAFIVCCGCSVSFAATSDALSYYNTSALELAYGNSFEPGVVKENTDYVDEYSGVFSVCETDITIPGKNGFDFFLNRRFNSRSSAGEVYETSYSERKNVKYGKAYPYLCTYTDGGTTVSKEVLVWFLDDEDLFQNNASVSFEGRILSASEFKTDPKGTTYCEYRNTQTFGGSGATYTRIIGEDYVNIYKALYEECYISKTSSKLAFSVGWGWEIPIPGIQNYRIRYGSNTEEDNRIAYDLFQTVEGNIYTLEIATERESKSSTTRSGWAEVSGNGKGFIAEFVNPDDTSEYKSLPNGEEYNFYVISPEKRTYYYNSNYDGTVVRFKGMSDLYDSYITYEETPLGRMFVDSYGNEILLNMSGISVNGKYVVKYEKNSINNDELDPKNEIEFENEYVFSVKRLINSDYDIEEKNISKSYHMERRSANTSVELYVFLPHMVEYETGMKSYFEYARYTGWIYLYEDDKHFYITSKYDEHIGYDNKKRTKFATTYQYDFISSGASKLTNEKTILTDEFGKTEIIYDSLARVEESETAETNGGKNKIIYTYINGFPSAPVSTETKQYLYKKYYNNITNYSYDSLGNMIKKKNGDYIEELLYDTERFGILLQSTVKKDANTTIKQENTLSDDGRVVLCSRIYENDVCKKATHYEYDDEYHIISESVVSGCKCGTDEENTDLITHQKIVYEYTEPESSDDYYVVTTTIGNIIDANSNHVKDYSVTEKYDFYRNKVYSKDNNGNETQYEYDDAVNRVIEQTNPDGSKIYIDYLDDLGTVNVTNPNGAQFVYVYDGWKNHIRSDVVIDGKTIVLEEHEYDSHCRETSLKQNLTDDKFFLQENTYNALNNPVKRIIKDESGNVISQSNYSYSYAYDNNGYLLTYVTSSSNEFDGYTPAPVTEIIDCYGNVIKKSAEANGTIIEYSYEYDLLGNMVSSTDANGNITNYEYDYMGNLLSQTDALGNVTSSSYDVLGNMISSTDAKGNTTDYVYDALGRNIEVISPFNETQNSHTRTFYDGNGNVLKTEIKRDENVYSSMEYTYDSMNRVLSCTTHPDNETSETTKYKYDIMGNLIQVKTGDATSTNPKYVDNDYSVVKYAYNKLNQLIMEQDFYDRFEYYTNDNFGNVISKTTRNEDVIDYEYNVFGKISKVTSKEETISYEYNQLGLVTKMTDNTGVTEYEYDAFGRLIGKTYEPSRPFRESFGKKITYTYDNNGNVLSANTVDTTDNTIWLNSYSYDQLNRVLTTGIDDLTRYTYDENGNILSMKKDNGRVDVTYEYNKANLTIVQNDAIFNKTYKMSYYPDGNMKEYDNGEKTTYVYDNSGRLTSEAKEDKYVMSYIYDNRGNRVRLEYDSEYYYDEDYIVWYKYNNKNQLIEEEKLLGDETECTDYTYDFNGNLYRKTYSKMVGGQYSDFVPPGSAVISTNGSEFISEFEFDSMDRMISSKVNNISSQYVYNGEGLRTFKTTDGKRTEYVYDGANIVAELEGEYVRNSYTRNLIGVEYDDYGNYHYYDPFRSVVGIADYYGNFVANTEYDAFGNEITSKNSISNYTPFGYRGEYTDSDTGFVYLRARMYDPTIGAFISEDPAEDGLNWYVYCSGNPVMFVDPWGLEYIVLSGGRYTNVKDDWGYEFIEPAIKKLRELKDLDDKENISWLIADAGWTKDDKKKFEDVAEDIGVNLKMIKTTDDFVNYVNKKNGNDRYKDKITKFAVFSHGKDTKGGTIELAYCHDNPGKLQISKETIEKKIWATAFDSPNSWFGACSLATLEDDSFAKAWQEKFGGKTWAFYGKSTYKHINVGSHPILSISRKKNGFSYYGSSSYPSEASDVINNIKSHMVVFE